MTDRGSLRRADLFLPFRPRPGGPARIGVEVECAVVDITTGHATRYGGDTGGRRLMELILENEGGDPVLGPCGVTGGWVGNGAKLTLESCGALEYSSSPAPDLATLIEDMQKQLRRCAEVADSLGLALVPGGNVPFDTSDDVDWTPDEHVRIMRDFCRGLGESGASSNEISALAVTAQTTLDYRSDRDLNEMLRLGYSSSSVAAALFVNSPLHNGRPSGALSWRMSHLRREDPGRFGYPPFAMRRDIAPEHYVEWLLGRPMLHRVRDGMHEPVPSCDFVTLMSQGFGDGSFPGLLDWYDLMSQVWPFVRLRETVELRLADGPPYFAVASAPAFWTGLQYHRPSRLAALELVEGRTIDDHLRTIGDVAIRGLDACHGGDSVRALAAELLRFAEEGLRARVAAGSEHPAVVRYLDPLYAVIESGETFAQQQLRRWEKEFSHSPRRFVEAYRI